MRPTLAAEELKRNLTQYLSTTFALADRPVRDSLERFLNHTDYGIFRGPYLRDRRATTSGLAIKGHAMTDFDPRPPNAWAVFAIVIAVLLLLAMLAMFLTLLFVMHSIASMP